MARNVTYSVSPRINPRDRESEPKFYGHVQASGDISLREMSERIQQTCTVHKSDVFAVLVALEDVITDALQKGEIVRLGDIVPFRLVSPPRAHSPRKNGKNPSSRRHASTSVRVLSSPTSSATSPSSR